MFLVHPEHAHLCPGLEELLPRLGAELYLVVYSSHTNPLQPTALLSIYSVLTLQTEKHQREAAANSLSNTLDVVARENPAMNIRGLLLRGDSIKDGPPQTPRYGQLDCLTAPAGGRFWFHEFPDLLSVILEEIAE